MDEKLLLASMKEMMTESLETTKAMITEAMETTKAEIIGTTKTMITEALEPVREDLAEVKERLGRVETRLGRVETRLDRVETRLDRVETRLDRVESDIAEVKLGLSGLNEVVAVVVDGVEATRKELQKENARLGLAVRPMSEVREELDSVQTRLFALEETAVAHTGQIRELQEKTG
jgi:chromosome segregation ATPase